MPTSIPPRSLPSDFGIRIAEMRRVAEERGHADVGYLLDLAGQIARQRENAAALGPVHWQGDGVIAELQEPIAG
jgi:hypothetical protein